MGMNKAKRTNKTNRTNGKTNKKSGTKKGLKTFSGRSASKRREKERSRRELMKIADELGVATGGAKIGGGALPARGAGRTARGTKSAEGVFSSTRVGFGFVTVEGEERDVFIPEGKTNGALDGDRVRVEYRKYTVMGEARSEGRVASVIAYGRETIIGTVCAERRGSRKWFFLAPDEANVGFTPHLRRDERLREGDKIEARLLRDGASVEAEFVRSFGESHSLEANYAAILAECEIATDFSPEELREAELFAAAPVTKAGREDMTERVVFTIDGESAKDLDDAVSLERSSDGWELGVHIADVSYYVRERSLLERAAFARGTSVYFTDKVVPMLPKSLSNGACSLNAGEDKYALSALITLAADGSIKRTRLVPSVIRSRVRGVYSEVNALLSGSAKAEVAKKYRPVLSYLIEMHKLYAVLAARSAERGALDLDAPEASVVLDESGAPIAIEKRECGDAERMIEQFMLTANEAVARLLGEAELPCVYRVHEPPPPDKLAAFLDFAHTLGFDATKISREKCTSRDFAALLAEAERRELSLPVSYTMLRALSKARYSEEAAAHFGLGIERYCHFTSPIRRLADLATHRIIRKTLIETNAAAPYFSYAKRAAAAASEAELRALRAERRIENLYRTIFMSSFVGGEFSAVVSSVTSFGLFCLLDNTCEGLVPLGELGSSFIFDEKTLTLRSAHARYKLGDALRVRLEEADVIRGKLRFSIVGAPESNSRASASKSRTHGGKKPKKRAAPKA